MRALSKSDRRVSQVRPVTAGGNNDGVVASPRPTPFVDVLVLPYIFQI